MSEREWSYIHGFGNEFESEAEPGALPVGCNNPQNCPLGLYAEQLSGTAFTALPHENQRSWLYRITPGVKQSGFEPMNQGTLRSAPDPEAGTTPNQLRWDPIPYPQDAVDFVGGLVTICVNGDLQARTGSAIHLYVATKSMIKSAFSNADGDFLIVPQEGGLHLETEFGHMEVHPGSFAVIQRGIHFAVKLLDGRARGYICENYGNHFRLPYRGAIGANGLANPRDFQSPVAAYEDSTTTFKIMTKYCGKLFYAEREGSPFNVVAWHGNYVPYRYDLGLFNTIGTVSFDHPDPSIFTVLTSPSAHSGTANLDFVIFPARWMVAEDTFRPPWYHRNTMSEYMGLVHGVYDAKPEGGGFVPGGASLHNCMSPHGPDHEAFAAASNAELKPQKLDHTLAFMFESNLVFHPTAFALNAKILQKDYMDCWQPLKSHFRLD